MTHIEITHKPSLLKEAIIQIGAGGSAGFVEACIMHPMDLIKTRFQLQIKTGSQDVLYYTGIVSLIYIYFYFSITFVFVIIIINYYYNFFF